MNCEQFALALVDDDAPDDRELSRHAEQCSACALLLDEEQRLLRTVQEWKTSTPAPALSLERRIAAALEAEREAPGAIGRAPRTTAKRGRGLRWLAAAAVLLLAFAGLSVVLRRSAAPVDPLAQAVAEVERAEQDYLQALARLEVEAAGVLARAEDMGLQSDQAALLASYRDRLIHLDAVLDDVRGFLEDNPGHAGGHTVLLAAYKEKAEVLREVLQLELGAET